MINQMVATVEVQAPNGATIEMDRSETIIDFTNFTKSNIQIGFDDPKGSGDRIYLDFDFDVVTSLFWRMFQADWKPC